MQYSQQPIHGTISGALMGAEIQLRILATSDLHANLLAWDYHSNKPCHQRGLARVATLIHTARRERPQNLLFDNGDFLHGTVLGDFLAETTPTIRSGRPLHAHPMIASMNALRYDAAALGNHEFGHGLGF
ncbi:metallophosphoesterase, partial [Cypionkella sp.]|uniref:metallophosphoesterase n=1 Tax=Cypionkella sp. TaxID=2811411 RepID=UPI00262CB62E